LLCVFLEGGKPWRAVKSSIELNGVEDGTVMLQPVFGGQSFGVKTVFPRAVIVARTTDKIFLCCCHQIKKVRFCRGP